MHNICRLTANTMNINGLRYDPCGIPASITSLSDITSPILTHWHLFQKNEHIHRTMVSSKLNRFIFATRTCDRHGRMPFQCLWIPFRQNPVIDSLAPCGALCRLRRVSLCIPLMLLTGECLTGLLSCPIIYVPMNDSGILLNVAVKEIGLRSVSVDDGRWTLTLFIGCHEGHPACKKTELWVAGMVICLGRDADFHGRGVATATHCLLLQ